MITQYGAVLWADPGGMTGLAKIEREIFHAAEYPFQEAGHHVWSFCSLWREYGAIGYERFTVFDDTHKKTPQPEALMMIGVIEWIAGVHGCQVLTPAQQHTPDPFDQRRLKALGWWVPGKNDAQSAACHLMRWCLSAGTMPPAMAARLVTHG